MRKLVLISGCLLSVVAYAQGPTVTSWLQNTTETGSYYMAGNSTAMDNGVIVNCQLVQYSTNWVYISTHGMPAYPTGPFQDGNPSVAQDQDLIFKVPQSPTENTGTPTATTPGNIGFFINGVAMFDYRDGVGWNSTTNSWCGGPGNPPCGGTSSWNRDAVVFERQGFDCSKGHPAMGNYHHHQNPSAFKLDLNVISTVCNLYDADGLYAIDETQHSPLIGYAYDGYPVYGAYGYKNADGTGGIVRIKSGYQLRGITERTEWADGTDVPDGPSVNSTYPLGTFREDYEFVTHPGEEDYLDEHNGRICITPEYPGGTYAYFATVDENWNSAYPYLVGPTFRGVVAVSIVNSVSEPTTVYDPTAGLDEVNPENLNISIFPNPATDLVAIQVNGLLREDLQIRLTDLSGKVVAEKKMLKGSSVSYFDVQTCYAGSYLITFEQGGETVVKKLVISK